MSGHTPGAISFKEATPSSTPAEREPGTVTFKTTPPSVPTPGTEVFARKEHPLLSNALASIEHLPLCADLRDKDKIRRLLSELLPVTQEAFEGWGARPLQKSGNTVQQVALLTESYASLQVNKTLATAIEQPPRFGFLSRSKGPSEKELSAVRVLHHALIGLQQQVSEVQLTDTLKALDIALICIQAIENVCPLGQNSAIQLAVDRRRSLLLAAASQCKLSAGQLTVLKDCIAAALAQSTKLLHVGLPAAQLVAAAKKLA